MALCAACMATPCAQGQEQAVATAPQRVSVSVSPPHLVLPMLEATGEWAIDDRSSVSLIVGFGSTENVEMVEFGVQACYYLAGQFEDGIKLGAEVLVGHLGDVHRADQMVGAGLASGLFLGIKSTAEFGLMAEVDVGVAAVLVALSSPRRSAKSASGSRVGPMLNLQLGWSR